MTDKAGIEDLRGNTILRNLFKTSDSENESESSEEEGGKERNLLEASSSAASTHPSTSSSFTSSSSKITISLYEERQKGIAFQLWPAAKLLCNYIDEHRFEEQLASYIAPNSVVIELGAGIGLCGLYLSACGTGHVVVTDLGEAIEIMEKNISLNVHTQAADTGRVVEAKELRWGHHQDVENILANLPFDASLPPLIIASDCVYWECLFIPLFKTLCFLVEEHGCTVLISHVKRWKKDQKFFDMCRKRMNVEIIKEDISYIQDENSFSGKERKQISRIYKISKML